jgi:hypothetical protein
MAETMIENPVMERRTTLDKFCYENGYSLVCSNWGSDGVKIELVHPCEGSRAVILPPDKIIECVGWLTRKLESGKPHCPAKTGKK